MSDAERDALHVGVIDINSRIVNLDTMRLERILSEIHPLTFSQLDRLEDAAHKNVDVMLIAAVGMQPSKVNPWLSTLQKSLPTRDGFKIPALVIIDIEITTQIDLVRKAALSNWYFDIVNPAHLESIPLRLSNLIRIHDHLYELNRYSEILDSMQKKIDHLETQIRK